MRDIRKEGKTSGQSLKLLTQRTGAGSPWLPSHWALSPLGLSSLKSGSGISREGTHPVTGRALTWQLCSGLDSAVGADTRHTVDLCSFPQGCLDRESRMQWPAMPGGGADTRRARWGPRRGEATGSVPLTSAGAWESHLWWWHGARRPRKPREGGGSLGQRFPTGGGAPKC